MKKKKRDEIKSVWKKYFLPLSCIIVISFLAYLPVLKNGFVNWDDESYILDNPILPAFNLKEIFSKYVEGNYHPLTMLAYSIQYHFFGVNAQGYHAVNLLIHLLNVVLVFYVFYLISDKPVVSLVTSLLFGIHPLHVESVAWASELKDLLYSFFFLAALVTYLKARTLLLSFQAIVRNPDVKNEIPHSGRNDNSKTKKGVSHSVTNIAKQLPTLKNEIASPLVKPNPSFAMTGKKKAQLFYVLTILFFICSLLSKAMAVSLPIVLLLIDYFLNEKITAKMLIQKIPFFILSIIFGVVAILAQHSSHSIGKESDFAFLQNIVFACYGFISYLIKIILPIHLNAFYPYPINRGESIPLLYYSFPVILAVLIAAVLYSLRISKKIFFGMGFFAITVFLVLQLIPVGGAIMADRYSYLPSIGIFYLAGEGIYWLWNKKGDWSKLKVPATLALTVLTIFLSMKTYSRCGIWKNSMTLWNSVISENNKVSVAYNNRGLLFAKDDNLEIALNDFNKALELNAEYPEALSNRGHAFTNQMKYDEAIADLNKAILLRPDFTDAYNNRGRALTSLKKFNEAVIDLNKAIELKPYFAEAYYNRGIAFVSLEKFAEAERDFNKTIELKPDFADVYNYKGILFGTMNRQEDALKNFSKTIELRPNQIDAYMNRAITLRSLKRNEEAVDDYISVINLNPNQADAYYNKALLEYDSGNKEEACSDFLNASKLGYSIATEAFDKYCH